MILKPGVDRQCVFDGNFVGGPLDIKGDYSKKEFEVHGIRTEVGVLCSGCFKDRFSPLVVEHHERVTVIASALANNARCLEREVDFGGMVYDKVMNALRGQLEG